MNLIVTTALGKYQCKLLFYLPLLFLSLLVMPHFLYAFCADDIIGIWITSDKKGKIQIYRCGRLFCGRIVSLSKPCYPPDDKHGMGGLPRVDRNNPNPDLRHRLAVGLTILEGFSFTGSDTWDRGSVYDPESGRTYKGKMVLKSSGTLKLRGYIGFSLFGRTTVWHRLESTD